jgi:DNA-binding protein HU-beta
MDEFRDNDLVCVARYCPSCGSEVFCRTDYDKHRVFYMSEDMNDPTDTCPYCQFDLLLLPVEAIMAMPGGSKAVPPPKVTAGKTFIESLHTKNPEIFTTKASAKRALDAVGRVIFDALAGGEGVRWSGLGSFKVRERKPRLVRNPRTGEKLQIPARRVVAFSPAQALKERLNG